MKVKIADHLDATRLSEVAERMFRETFSKQNDPAQMDAYCRATYAPVLQQAELRRPTATVFLVEDGNAIVAYAQVNLTRPDELEIERFYVDAGHHGRGLAHELMTRCLDFAREQSCRRVWLGVWQHNARAIAFYRKHGFEVSGEHVFMLGTDPQNDYIMELQLT